MVRITKNQIRLEIMELQTHFQICLAQESQQISYLGLPIDSIFDKYKHGMVSVNAPFKLFDSNSCTSCEEDSSSQNTHGRRARGPYRKYTCEEKLQAVYRIQNGEDVKAVSKEFGIPRRNLLRWKKNGCERKEGGGRPTDCEMEALIHAKIKNGELTDQKQIRKYAVEVSKLESFKASKGWYVKFCNRYQVRIGISETAKHDSDVVEESG